MRIETFFRDTKQDFGFGDCELRHAADTSRHWHLLMLAYSLLKLGAAHSVLGNNSQPYNVAPQRYRTILGRRRRKPSFPERSTVRTEAPTS
jgi:hypothetical protein